jgi:hypothetical protein
VPFAVARGDVQDHVTDRDAHPAALPPIPAEDGERQILNGKVTGLVGRFDPGPERWIVSSVHAPV